MLTCHLQILFAYGMALYMIQLFLMPATCKHVWRVEEVGMGGSWETAIKQVQVPEDPYKNEEHY